MRRIPKLLNYGSLNYDYVYTLDHIVRPGETLSSSNRQVFFGGKGLNQSVALARAGVDVYHGGQIGEDGGRLIEALESSGVDCRYIRKSEAPTGHAVIQVDSRGQNSIVLFGGANQTQTCENIKSVLGEFDDGDYLLLQNEISQLEYIIGLAYEKNMKIALNPSPFDERLAGCDLKKVSLFLMNEIEGEQLTEKSDPDAILDVMKVRYPGAQTILTLGKRGVLYGDARERHSHGIFNTEVVDTTAAGDTFTGYFLAVVLSGKTIPQALRIASIASGIAVSRKGAMASIPYMEEVRPFY